MAHDEKSRIPLTVANKLLTAAQSRLMAMRTTSPALRGFVEDTPTGPTARRRRIELLDMRDHLDIRRWQIVHNDTERYAVISEKFTTVRGELDVDYRCVLVYLELGEDLPLYKTDAELRADDEDRAGLRAAAAAPEVEPDFSDLTGGEA